MYKEYLIHIEFILAGFIPLPEATVTQVSLPIPSASPPVVPSVPTVTPQTNATAPHPLMLPFGLPSKYKSCFFFYESKNNLIYLHFKLPTLFILSTKT